MGEFATIILGLGLISLGAALILQAAIGYKLPPGITEIAVTVLAIAGRALLANGKGSTGTQDPPSNIGAESSDPTSHGAPSDSEQSSDLRNGKSVSSHVSDS
jgi:hypothetical protein